MAYGDFNDLARRTASDIILRDKAFSIAKNPKYDEYEKGLTSIVYEFFDKKTASLTDKSALGSGIKSVPQNQQLAEELHKPSITKFKKRKLYSSFKDNTWDAGVADMQSISKFNKRFRFLSCVIDIFSKYAWVDPLKDKKGVTTVNAFQSTLKDSTKKTKKKIRWLDIGSAFYNNSFKKLLQNNDIEMYSTHNEGKSVVTESFIRTLKTKFTNT